MPTGWCRSSPPVRSAYEIGRVDPDYAAPLLRDTFRYGNLADPKVYCDYFIQYNPCGVARPQKPLPA